MTDIILNLKNIRFRQYTVEPITLKISKQGPGPVTAADIQVTDKIEVLNPEQHLATVGGNSTFNAEIIVSFEEVTSL